MRRFVVTCFCVAGLLFFGRVFALDGAIGIHDPSTVAVCDGQYYVFGTGRGIPILTSSNAFDWQRGGRVFDRIPDSVKSYVPKNDGAGVWAPDIIKVDDQYYLYGPLPWPVAAATRLRSSKAARRWARLPLAPDLSANLSPWNSPPSPVRTRSFGSLTNSATAATALPPRPTN